MFPRNSTTGRHSSMQDPSYTQNPRYISALLRSVFHPDYTYYLLVRFLPRKKSEHTRSSGIDARTHARTHAVVLEIRASYLQFPVGLLAKVGGSIAHSVGASVGPITKYLYVVIGGSEHCYK